MALRRSLALFNAAGSASSGSTSTSAVSRSLRPGAHALTAHLAPSELPPTARAQHAAHKTLYQQLSALPGDGVGVRVRQRRWLAKGLDRPMGVPIGPPRKAATGAAPEKDSGHLCYWEVTRVRLKDEGRHGKAWGRLVWRGRPITPEGKDERIPGGLKYAWDVAR